MPIKTTLLAVTAAVAFGASVYSVATPCFAASEKTRIFERSIHGTYNTAGRKTTAAPAAIKSIGAHDFGTSNLTEHTHPVTATASASGRGGYWLRRFKARSRAITQWRINAAEQFGPGSTRWLLSRQKQVSCSSLSRNVICTVSALPATAWQRLGLASY